jgi:RHS repeat-associated protein
VTDSYEYDAFGNSFTMSGTTPNNYLYRGEQYDSDLGLYYLRARYYNPATGRFMSRDPEDGNQLDPKSLHKYLYADGDPINGIDPTGRAEFIESVFTRTLISSPLESGTELLTKSAVSVLCGAARYLNQVTKFQPPNMPSPIGVPLWPLRLIPYLCTGAGF